MTEIPECSSESVYFVTAVFVFKTFTFVLIKLSAARQLWHHGILSLGLPSRFSHILASDKHWKSDYKQCFNIAPLKALAWLLIN